MLGCFAEARHLLLQDCGNFSEVSDGFINNRPHSLPVAFAFRCGFVLSGFIGDFRSGVPLACQLVGLFLYHRKSCLGLP